MGEVITSLQNPKVKQVLRLQEKASERKKLKLTLVEGKTEIRIALNAGIPVQSIFYLQNKEKEIKNFFAEYNLQLGRVNFWAVSENVFAKIAYRENSFGAVCVVQTPENSLHNLVLASNPLVLVLENVEKPGNLGAILRTADAAGVDAILLCNTQTDLFNPNVVRASLGCVFTQKVILCTNQEAFEFLSKNHFQILATALTASVPYTTINYCKPTAIVMGTEATGLSTFWRQKAHQNIIIPMRGKIDSMNVSVATAIIIFEAIRQRKLTNKL
ncbi:MAG: RNA methyltransferase [Raineya sp.]|nr:RNA methyltransferase [Raineya sp.]